MAVQISPNSKLKIFFILSDFLFFVASLNEYLGLLSNNKTSEPRDHWNLPSNTLIQVFGPLCTIAFFSQHTQKHIQTNLSFINIDQLLMINLFILRLLFTEVIYDFETLLCLSLISMSMCNQYYEYSNTTFVKTSCVGKQSLALFQNFLWHSCV